MKKDCTISLCWENKDTISCQVTIQLIGTFVFADAKSRFSHNAAHVLKFQLKNLSVGIIISCNVVGTYHAVQGHRLIRAFIVCIMLKAGFPL